MAVDAEWRLSRITVVSSVFGNTDDIHNLSSSCVSETTTTAVLHDNTIRTKLLRLFEEKCKL